MKVGDKASDDAGTWTVVKIWLDGDVTLIDESGYMIDVSAECFEHYYHLESE